jgi:predicted exporter
VFERVHVVAIIFTTVLIGVALDYGIYTLSHAQRTAGGMRQALREIRFPLIAGCLTSVGGFVFMTLTNLPMLQQMGLAVALGLVFALGLDFLYLPWMPALLLRAPVEKRSRLLSLEGALFPLLIVALAAAAAGLVAVSHVRWNDDVRTLQAMSPELQDEQNALRQLFGQSDREHLVLTFGPDLDAAFANLAKLNAALDAASKTPADSYFNLGRLFPATAQSARCRDYFRAHPDFTPKLRAALDENFKADAFAPFWEEWNRWLAGAADPAKPAPTPAQLIDGLRSVLPLPLQSLWNDEPGAQSAWLATRINDPLFRSLPPGVLAAPTAPVDQVETLNGALLRYRLTATQRAGVGLGIIAIAVMAVYGWRRGGFMLAIPALSMMLAVAALALMGQRLGLLHVVALLLGFCLASDYSIFLGSPGNLPHSTRRAIRLAASTAFLSFLVLSFSKIEALRAICLTVTLVIGFVLIFCEASYWLFVRMKDEG